MDDATLKLLVKIGQYGGSIFGGLAVIAGFLAGSAGITLSNRSDSQLRDAQLTARSAASLATEARSQISAASNELDALGGKLADVSNDFIKLQKQAEDTRIYISARTLTKEQAKSFQSLRDECKEGAVVQANYHDPEAFSFRDSLVYAFRDAGVEVYRLDLPLLESHRV